MKLGLEHILLGIIAIIVCGGVLLLLIDAIQASDLAYNFCKEKGFENGSYYSQYLEIPSHITCVKRVTKTFCYEKNLCRTETEIEKQIFYPNQQNNNKKAKEAD